MDDTRTYPTHIWTALPTRNTTTGNCNKMNTVAVGSLAGPSGTRLSSQVGDPHSGLRAVTECTGSAVVVHVGGDIDASNETIWRRLVSRSAAISIAPGPFVIDVR